jgi:hypothetical protein
MSYMRAMQRDNSEEVTREGFEADRLTGLGVKPNGWVVVPVQQTGAKAPIVVCFQCDGFNSLHIRCIEAQRVSDDIRCDALK